MARQLLEHNGKQYSSPDAWRTAKATQSPKQTAPAMEEGEPGDEDPHEVVAQHGPADAVSVTHSDGEDGMGSHEVHSQHPDGHEHHSMHGSRGEAHQHGTCLGGECSCGGM